MAKVDFAKVEQALRAGLLKMEAEELLYLADLANSFEAIPKPKEEPQKMAGVLTSVLRNLQADLRKLRKLDEEMYGKLNIDRKEVQNYFENPGSLKPEDWENIKKIREKIRQYKNEIRQNLPGESDQEIIKNQRKRQKDRRFNTNDKWLPLH